MNNIKKWKQLTHVHLRDGRILVTESNPKEIYDWITNHSHIMIEGELHSKYSIDTAIPAKIDDLENLIMNQPKEIQKKVREKKVWLKDTVGKEMDYKYAVNFINNLTNANNGN